MAALDSQEQILVAIATSLLDSAELREAQVRLGISTDVLLSRVKESAGVLLCTHMWGASSRLSLADTRVRRLGAFPFPNLVADARRQHRQTALKVLFRLVFIAGLTVAWAFTREWIWPALAAVAVAFLLPGKLAFLHYSPWVLADPEHELVTSMTSAFLRQQVNELVNTPELERSFDITGSPGLSGLSDRDQIAPTLAEDRLRTVIAEMAEGSIGISGPRGVGKSTLLRGLCDAKFARTDGPTLPILVSAPVDYDIRDFILHLFGRLCTAVVDSGLRPAAAVRAVPHGRSRWLPLLAAAAAAAGGLALLAQAMLRHSTQAQIALTVDLLVAGLAIILGGAAATAGWLYHPGPSRGGHEPRMSHGAVLAALFAVALSLLGGGGVILYRNLRHPPQRLLLPAAPYPQVVTGAALLAASLILVTVGVNRRRPRRSIPFEEQARQQLERIRFLQTFTTGYSGTLQLGTAAQVGTTFSRQLVEQQLTLPEIVQEYREFAQQAAQWWRERHHGSGRLIVGIDEVDKIRSGEAAERFVNDIKSIFGSPHCLYLAAVSEDALTSFEQQALTVRSVFSSAFDEMIRVDRLTFDDARELLRRRVAGIPDIFIALCYALSGGLPRDVLRAARALVDVRSGGYGTIGWLTTAMIDREISNLKHAALWDQAGSGAAAGVLLGNLIDQDWPGSTAAALLDAARQAMAPEAASASAQRLGATLYFLATVMAVFGPVSGQLAAQLLGQPGAQGRPVDRLVQARSALAFESNLAIVLISRFRREFDLDVLSVPAAPAGQGE